ncbi:formin-like protein 18 [Triticum dicoccoides]|uniref:formin-like protein 18 n=1 Tax=Triticum dicoccoides TaxID=85692 RepID=UPI00188F4412|nr:formin-like protein 18 [Triticum dicoccoides]
MSVPDPNLAQIWEQMGPKRTLYWTVVVRSCPPLVPPSSDHARAGVSLHNHREEERGTGEATGRSPPPRSLPTATSCYSSWRSLSNWRRRADPVSTSSSRWREVPPPPPPGDPQAPRRRRLRAPSLTTRPGSGLGSPYFGRSPPGLPRRSPSPSSAAVPASCSCATRGSGKPDAGMRAEGASADLRAASAGGSHEDGERCPQRGSSLGEEGRREEVPADTEERHHVLL